MGPEKTQAAIVLLVKDHMDHGVGCTDSSLDVKPRVAWAWRAVKSSRAAKRGAVTLLSLNVASGSVNGSKTGQYAELLAKAAVSAGEVLPALAQSWDSNAPKTLRGNLSAKIGAFDKVKHRSFESVRRQALASTKASASSSSSDSESEGETVTVEAACALPMTSLQGAKRAAQAMLVASVFAAELSNKAGVPVLVLGRPPGHHATCAHQLCFDAPRYCSPGGSLTGKSLGGGCFYPSCWLAAVHCMREGMSQKLAYIDIDAHKPDGVWKEVDHLCRLGSAQRAAVLKGQPDACQGMVFASVHVNGFPNPSLSNEWKSVDSTIPKADRRQRKSVDCTIPKADRRAFEIRVHEELLPPGVATGTVQNDAVLRPFHRWRTAVSKDLHDFKPTGTFVGLGFDLHKSEEMIGDKAAGLGLEQQHYRRLIADFPMAALQGPIVLTLEGGYTKAAVVDGICGVMEGLEDFCRRAKSAKRISRITSSKHARTSLGSGMRRTSHSTRLEGTARTYLSKVYSACKKRLAAQCKKEPLAKRNLSAHSSGGLVQVKRQRRLHVH